MVERPRFSILMPTHSGVDVIGHAIQSVLDQTEPDFELLVVGDGCAAGTEDIVSGFGDPRIRFFDLPKAAYFGYANRNVALREARGSLIAFAADDDLWFPDHLAKLGHVLARGAALAYSPALWVSTDGVIAPFLTNLELDDELEDFLGRYNTLCANCIVYRADSLPRLDAWPEDVPAAADWRLWHKIIRANPGHPVEYCRIPTVLHFSARRKQSRHANSGYLAVLLEIADGAGWWPAALRVAIPEGVAEQAVIADLMRADPSGWTQAVRQASGDLTARLARDFVMTGRPLMKRAEHELAVVRHEVEVLAGRLAEKERAAEESAALQAHELGAVRSERDARVHELEAIRSSTSWRITGPLRSAITALRRL